MNWTLTVAGFGVGVVVGLTGMGGGALMTPVLVLFFGVPPLAAVSSDLVASAVMKPVGSLVHIVRRTVDWRLVGWLSAGSVPCAFSGVLLARAVGGGPGSGARVENLVRLAVGIALLLAVAGLVAKGYLGARAERNRPAPVPAAEAGATAGRRAAGPVRVPVRPVPTLLLGAAGGLVVGMTSVGSGSLIIVALLLLYPALRPSDLVGTDLVQAVPLVASAAIGHLLFGDFRLAVTASLLLGSVPGVFVGAQVSARARGPWIRPVLAIVLLASALKLLGAPDLATLSAIVAGALFAIAGGMLARRRRAAQSRPAEARLDGSRPAGPQSAEPRPTERQPAERRPARVPVGDSESY